MNQQGSVKTYVIGYVLSIVLTMLAFTAVVLFVAGDTSWLTSAWVVASIVVLAVVQLLVQLIFFLHLGRGSKPRWNLVILLFAAIVVVILVGGSLWIMSGLNYHMTPGPAMNNSIIQDEGIH